MKTAGSKTRHRALKRLLAVAVFCLLVLGGLVGMQMIRTEGRILANVSVGGVYLGGLKPEEARMKLDAAFRLLNAAGIRFTYGSEALTIKANDRGPEGSLTPLINFDIDGMARKAFAYGHESGPLDLARSNLQALFSDTDLPVDAAIDTTGISKLLAGAFGHFERPKRDADLAIIKTKTEPAADASASATQTAADAAPDYEISVVPESDGLSFDFGDAVRRATADLSRWHGADVDMKIAQDMPAITTGKALEMRDGARKILKRGAPDLGYDDARWPIDQTILETGLTLKSGPGDNVILGIRPEALVPLFDAIGAQIEKEASPTHFKIDKEKAVGFIGGQLGRRFNREATLALIDGRLADDGVKVIPVVTSTFSSPDSDPIAEELGIREMIGFGTSSMAGSPKNRRKNIANGVGLLNGVFIKPGEEFSLLEHLKPFDEKNGYSKELIIKGNRTVPDYGGGLCQIGTTTFRATMGAGLPVTMRQNHSYRVRYYEPAGTDATIFDPAPDYRFMNDTGNDLLLVTKVIKDQLRFEFWGTRDGRVEKQSKVKLWDETQPPDPNNIETSELPDGKKKCFETAHPGAKTSFTYTITYQDGTTKDKEFRSLYKPWQEQCLVGKTGAPHIILNKDGDIEQLPPPPVVQQPPGF